MITAERYHDISCGHRVVGHESKCRHLHGHNYRIHFKCRSTLQESPLDSVGRVVDFSVIKSQLCMWVEQNWDHKFLAWEQDAIMRNAADLMLDQGVYDLKDEFGSSIIWVPFNPTAENMAKYLVEVVGPMMLAKYYVELYEVTIEETAKCSATYSL